MTHLRTIIVGGVLLIAVQARGADVVADATRVPIATPTILTDEYAFDSGFGFANVAGRGSDTMWWLNQFTVLAGFEVITGIRIAWGQVPAGLPAEILLFGDPNHDGNPTDITPADLLVAKSILCDAGPTNTFVTYPVPNIFVGNAGDSFFVGVCMSLLTLAYFPARLDITDPDHRRSWYANDPRTSGVDCSNPNAAAEPLVLWDAMNVAFTGDWMLRANATAATVTVAPASWGRVKAIYR